MSYYQDIAIVAKQIGEMAKEIEAIEKARREWIRPEGATFWIGYHTYVTRKDGTTPTSLEGIKREALKTYDTLIFAKQAELEGLRFKLVNLAKQGGAA